MPYLKATFPFELSNRQRVKFSLDDATNAEIHGRIYIPRKLLKDLKDKYPKEVELTLVVKF